MSSRCPYRARLSGLPLFGVMATFVFVLVFLFVFLLAHLSPEASAQTASSPSKKDLITQILKLQQPVVEGLAQALAEQPAAQLIQQARLALQTGVAAERRLEVGRGLQADVKKYLDEAVPPLKEQAIQLAPATVGLFLEEKFTEDELKELIAILESPINRRLQELSAQMQRVLSDTLMAQTHTDLEAKVRVLQQNMLKRLENKQTKTQTQAPSAEQAKPAAKP